MKSVRTDIKPEEANENSTKTVFREIYGPIGEAKSKYQHENTKVKWAEKTFSTIMKPADKLAAKSVDGSTGRIVGFGLFCAAGALAAPSVFLAVAATPVAFGAGALKEAKDKVKTKIKEHHANKHIRPF